VVLLHGVGILNTTISNDLGWQRRYYVIPNGMDGVLLCNSAVAGFAVRRASVCVLNFERVCMDGDRGEAREGETNVWILCMIDLGEKCKATLVGLR
jgi:hypothetical protein